MQQGGAPPRRFFWARNIRANAWPRPMRGCVWSFRTATSQCIAARIGIKTESIWRWVLLFPQRAPRRHHQWNQEGAATKVWLWIRAFAPCWVCASAATAGLCTRCGLVQAPQLSVIAATRRKLRLTELEACDLFLHRSSVQPTLPWRRSVCQEELSVGGRIGPWFDTARYCTLPALTHPARNEHSQSSSHGYPRLASRYYRC